MNDSLNHVEPWVDVPRDFLASIVVFLVALPLCMGIAIASGVPVSAGLITGIVGGLVVATIAGSPLQVSGPAAGLVVLVFDAVQTHGIEALGIIVLLCGLFQFAAGLCRLGQWFRAVSPTVIHAMLTGIGILIVAGQLHVMVDDRPRESGIKNIVTAPEAILKGLPWPQWTSREDNQARSAFLKRIGTLHERQVEIRNAVDAHVSQHGTTREHQQQAEGLTRISRRQEELAQDWQNTMEELSRSAIHADNPQRKAAIEAAVAQATGKVQLATKDLELVHGDDVRASQDAAAAGMAQVLPQLKSHDWAAKVGLLTILAIIFWNFIPIKAIRAIPASLVAVVLATGICAVLALPVLYVEIPLRIADAVSPPTLTVFKDVSLMELVKVAFMMALIASAETLLCASAVDKMHSGPRTRYDQELMAQGVGNTVCGLLGALPMTGVIVRSAANVQAGAKTQWSAFFHGVWLLVFVVALGDVLRMIPIACLAGILVYTGYKLIDYRTLLKLWKEDKAEALIFVATVGLIVGEDLLTGVVAGFVLSAIKLLVMFSHLQAKLVIDELEEKAQLELAGAATFLRLPVLAAKLDKVPAGAELHVDLAHLDYIDHACLELLMSWAEQHKVTGGRLVVDWGQLHARVRSTSNRPRKVTEHHAERVA
jgi:MFS superfamily sulfate permease-like transporter